MEDMHKRYFFVEVDGERREVFVQDVDQNRRDSEVIVYELENAISDLTKGYSYNYELTLGMGCTICGSKPMQRVTISPALVEELLKGTNREFSINRVFAIYVYQELVEILRREINPLTAFLERIFGGGSIVAIELTSHTLN